MKKLVLRMIYSTATIAVLVLVLEAGNKVGQPLH